MFLIVFLIYFLLNKAFSLFKSYFFLEVKIKYFSTFNKYYKDLVKKLKLFFSKIYQFIYLKLCFKFLLTTLVALLETFKK